MATKTATILTRTEPETKEKADKLFSRLGLTTSNAINIFLHRSLEAGGIPFRVVESRPNIPDMDEMTDDEIKALLDESMEEIKAGKTRPFEEVMAEMEAKYGFRI